MYHLVETYGVRIISGEHKGRKLLSVRGMATRPTSGRVREALFNILGSELKDAKVLDLFAGTGALGIEALSRGAGEAVFIDDSTQAISVLRRNLDLCRVASSSRVIHWNIAKNLHCLTQVGHPFDLIFLDPPYHKQWVPATLAHLQSTQCLCVGTTVVAEHEAGLTIEASATGLVLDQTRCYGRTALSFFSFQSP